MVNLKKVLMDLGNELVMEHGYEPATGKSTPGVPNTVPIKAFTDYINNSPEAIVTLRKLGVEWPTAIVPSRKCPRCGYDTKGTREGDTEYCTHCGVPLGPTYTGVNE